MKRKGIEYHYFDGGDKSAGSIEMTQKLSAKKGKNKKAVKPSEYLMKLNQNHSPIVQFSTRP
ncbi:hypothetical protein [Pseudomonas sp. NPDC087690]|jgi:hypothetical protein|uniref:hypothetical protein n=1 Tax=Pseudomonas sp. NPDC087690 TaxID=3364446 RepID=UPI0037FF22DF